MMTEPEPAMADRTDSGRQKPFLQRVGACVAVGLAGTTLAYVGLYLLARAGFRPPLEFRRAEFVLCVASSSLASGVFYVADRFRAAFKAVESAQEHLATQKEAILTIKGSLKSVEGKINSIASSGVQELLDAYEKQPRVADCLRRLSRSAARDGERHLDVDSAERLLNQINLKFDPRPSTTKLLNDEAKSFERVIKRLKVSPTIMRFTDMRAPEQWEVDNHLHEFLVALAFSILDRPVEKRWLAYDASGPGKGVYPEVWLRKEVIAAIERCLENYDLCCSKTPLGQARRLVCCKKWALPKDDGPQATEFLELRELLESALFGRRSFDMHEVSAAATAFMGGRDLCSVCENRDQRKCDGVREEDVTGFLTADHEKELQFLSIFEVSDLYKPRKYCHDDVMRDDVLADTSACLLHVHGEGKDEPAPPGDFYDCYRTVFWRPDLAVRGGERPYVADLADLWDRVLKMPVFWIDPSVTANAKLSTDLLRFFIGAGCDYGLLAGVGDLGDLAFKTTLAEGEANDSEVIESGTQQFDDLKANFDALISAIGQVDARTPPRKVLLAPHAMVYNNHG